MGHSPRAGVGPATRHLRMPSPAMLVACIALLVALGGTSYAAVSLPANSVGTLQLKNGAVTNTKVKTHSLTAAVFKQGTLLQGAAGAVGPAGPAGPPGAAGTPGAAGATGPAGTLNTSKLSFRVSSTFSVLAGGSTSNTLGCLTGHVISGGFFASAPFQVQADQPSDATSWSVALKNTTGSTQTWGIVILCYAG